MTPKVFIVQEPLKRDRTTGRLAPFMDMSPARLYGEIQEPLLATGHTVPLATAQMMRELHKRLISFTKEDYLLLAGDTGAIAAAAMVAAGMTGGTVNILKWDRDTKSYIKLTLEV